MNFKQKTYYYFQQQLENKIANLRQQLNDLKESTANETKSTAGDKYETARAMLQIEQDIVRRQLQEFMEQQSVVSSIDPQSSSMSIIMGSFVKTNKDWFFISTALGKASIENENVTALSPQSPLGKILMGKTVGSTVLINSISYSIDEIL